jgi:ribosomal protein S18 acetylase RimI-like enzyme
MGIRILDVTDEAGYALLPPCADAGFDHRSCTYWEDADRGSKAARSVSAGAGPASAAARTKPRNPFALDDDDEPAVNPFAPPLRPAAANPFLTRDDEPAENPFAPRPVAGPTVAADAPHKLRLLVRGHKVFGSYAKILEEDGLVAAYVQFGPLSAYPRALRTRELYPKLPVSPLPAVITCISTTSEGRGRGHAATLVAAVCDDLAARGFAAVEVYPEVGARLESTSAAQPAFWERQGFVVAAPDERFPVLRRELT